MSDDIYFSDLSSHHLYDGMEEEYCSGEELLIPGPVGPIETLTSCPDCYTDSRPIAIVSHPHPLFGGSMQNKVVHILARSFNDMGLLSVTFNFRGVGRSGGNFAKGDGEVDDLLAVVEHFRQRYPQAPLWLAGFSFGAFVTLRAHQRAGAERMLLVAPPVSMFDFTSAPEVAIPWMVMQGGKDEIIDPQAVSRWALSRPNRPLYHWMTDADHFFHGRLNRLHDKLLRSWNDAILS